MFLIVGVNSKTFPVFLGWIMTVFFIVRLLIFKDSLETSLDDLYEQVKEEESLMKQILKIMPEGVIIQNANQSSSINFINKSAL
jgi:hypothetical protein